MKINLNDIVKFKLTKYGEQYLKKYCDNINDEIEAWLGPDDKYDYNEHYCKKIKGNKKEYREEQLWQLMHIFGSDMRNGGETIFKNMIIEIDEKNIIK
jgi:hypothetical protein